jgi:hypothetical protein
MTGRIAHWLFPVVATFFAVGAALAQGMQTFRLLGMSKQRSGIARPILSYGSTHQAQIITLGATLGSYAAR